MLQRVTTSKKAIDPSVPPFVAPYLLQGACTETVLLPFLLPPLFSSAVLSFHVPISPRAWRTNPNRAWTESACQKADSRSTKRPTPSPVRLSHQAHEPFRGLVRRARRRHCLHTPGPTATRGRFGRFWTVTSQPDIPQDHLAMHAQRRSKTATRPASLMEHRNGIDFGHFDLIRHTGCPPAAKLESVPGESTLYCGRFSSAPDSSIF